MIKLARRAAAALILALAGCATEMAPQPELSQVKVFGNTSTIELAPVLLASHKGLGGPSAVSNGGIPNLFNESAADLATNAETQALRQSLDHPDLRIIMTVSEGLYRIVARKSSGIDKLSDLKGKKIATVPNTSSAYFLHKMLKTVGLTETDVTVVRMFPLNRMPPALKSGEVDAVTIWEPEIENAMEAIGPDAVQFSGKGVYRELFNLHAREADLSDPVKRARIVAYVRGLIAASKQVRNKPKEVWPLVAESTKYSEDLIEKVWEHEAYPGLLVSDVLDVMVEEEVWVAKERNRTPRNRAELATLVDDSIMKEALGR